MSSPSPAFSPPRVAPHLGHACGGVWRLTYRRFLTPGALLQLAGLVALLVFLGSAMVREGRTRVFCDWTNGIYFSSVLPILAFLAGSGMIRDELKPGSVDYTLTRPVPRPAYFVFKFFSQLACLQILYLFALASVVGVGVLRQIPGVMDAVPAMLLAQGLTLGTFLAFGCLCGILTSRYLVLGIAWAAVIEVGVGNIPTQLNQLSITHQIRAILEPYLPNAPAGFVPEQGIVGLTFALLGATLLMVAAAAALFSQRELTGARDA